MDREMSQHNYTFTALRGIQAGREYYLVLSPLKLIHRIFIYDESEVPPELRAQRVLNKARIPEIARYIVDNPTEYTFSALTASIDGDIEFVPANSSGPGYSMGELRVSMAARFLINDGQHRREAIEEALKLRPELGNETIAVVFFIDTGLERSQQMFADLNTHAVRPSRSISVLYEHRDSLATLVRRLIDQVPIFVGRTELEKTSISNRSTKVFTLSGVFQATEDLLRHAGVDRIDAQAERLAVSFWTHLTTAMIVWQWVLDSKTAPMDLRQNYVNVHGVVLHALAKVGGELIRAYPEDWKRHLEPLRDIDWRRSNPAWEGRAIVGGRMSKAQQNLSLTTAYIKGLLSVPLSNEEERIEALHSAGKRGALASG
jgi:DNA sulfur modification protein DndB